MIPVIPRLVLFATVAATVLTGCTPLDHVERSTFAPDSLLAKRAPSGDAAPIKAHMPDGSVYVFTQWNVASSDSSIMGFATHFSPDRDTLSHGVMSVPINSVALVETNVRTASLAPAYFAILTAASAALAVYCLTTPKACFGSCPTIYSATAEGYVLEAESFSHSIAPLFELRDVDRIGAQPDAEGTLRLEVRNEALETHYINHLELLEVEHEVGGYAVPGGRGDALVLDDFASDAVIIDRAGNDVSGMLASTDGVVFETSPATLASVSSDDAFDYLDLAMAAPRGDSAAVLLRFRASLLSTVLFYDFMLAGQGVDAIGWQSRTLDTIAGAVQIGEFYTRWMGIRISVRDGGVYRPVGRIGGAGPIAWDDAALVVPVPEADSLRLRITFLADAFRIDRLAVARSASRHPLRTIPLTRVESTAMGRHADQLGDAERNHEHLANSAAPDERYLTTYPGTSFDAVFEVGTASDDRDHTYFLASQGYYVEWIRREWLQRDTTGMPALGSDEMLHQALRRWRVVKSDYEDLFFRTKIPVR